MSGSEYRLEGLATVWARWVLAGALLVGCLAGAAEPQTPVAFPERILVVLDPGHGGAQKGAVGRRGTQEKKLVLEVAKQIRAALASVDGIEILMTRESDDEVSLWDRVDLANRAKAHAFVSIHANSFTRASMRGMETFFHSVEASGEEARRVASTENAQAGKATGRPEDPVEQILEDMHRDERLRDSSRLAQLVQDALARHLPFENLGVGQADFIVLRGTRMPSVLIEIGFLSNRQEERALGRDAIQQKLARAVREALIQFRDLLRQKHGLPPLRPSPDSLATPKGR